MTYSVEYPKDTNAIVNEKITKKADFSGNGNNEIITILYSSKNFKTPFTWSVKVTSSNKEIFSYTQNDKNIDPFFKDLGYVDNDCKDYIECKFTHYFENIPKLIIMKFYEKDFEKITKSVKEHLIGNDDSEIIAKLQLRLKKSEIPALFIYDSPVDKGKKYYFVSEINKFIQIYE